MSQHDSGIYEQKPDDPVQGTVEGRQEGLGEGHGRPGDGLQSQAEDHAGKLVKMEDVLKVIQEMRIEMKAMVEHVGDTTTLGLMFSVQLSVLDSLELRLEDLKDGRH